MWYSMDFFYFKKSIKIDTIKVSQRNLWKVKLQPNKYCILTIDKRETNISESSLINKTENVGKFYFKSEQFRSIITIYTNLVYLIKYLHEYF